MTRQPSPFFQVLRQNRLWISRFLAVFMALWQIGQPLQAASATWNGLTSGDWATVGNWSATPVPGTGDNATFNNSGGGFTTINLGAGVTLNSLLFDTASAAAYTIGSAPGQVLTLNAAGNITMNAAVAANQTVAANLALGATATFSNDSTTNNLLLNGVISGATALSKTGAGILELNGANTFTGITTISAGTVKLGNATALGSSAAATDHTVVGAGATLDLNGLSIAENFGRGGATLPLDGFGGATAILTNSNATAAAITGTINFDGAGAFTVNGAAGSISLSRVARTNGTSGDGLITKDGTNTLILAGTADNISLQVTVNNGVVQLNKGGSGVRALGGATTTIGAAGTLRLTTGQTNLDQIFANVNVVNNGIFDLQGQNEGFNSMTGTGQVTNGATNDPSTLTLGENNGIFTWGGVIQDGAGTSTVALTKVGIGTMTITNNNTYTGTTSMNGNGGGIALDFAAVGGTNDNLIAATSALSLTNTSPVRTQILTVTGDAAVTNNQTFASTTFATTADRRYQIATSSGAGGTLNLNLGAFNTPTGVYVDFVLPTTGGIFTSNTAGILANTYTVNNGGSLAQVLGGQVVAFSGNLIAQTGVNVDALAAYTGGARHLLVDNTSTGDVTQSAGTLGLATIQITDTADRTLTIGTGNTLAVSSTGGAGTIIRGNTAGSVVIGAAASPGELIAGTAAGDDLILSNSNATGTLTVNSVIKNNAGGAVDVVIGGATAATTVLTGNNSFNGSVAVQAGTLRIGHANALGTTAGGTTVSAGSALELTGGISVGDEALSINGAGVGSNGALRNFSGVNTYSGLVTATNTPEIQAETGTTLTFDRPSTATAVTTDSSITFDTVGTGIITFNDAFNTTGSANPTITKGGAGTLNFTVANTWAGTGSFTLNDGVVRISNGGALGGITGGTSVTDNAALELIGGITTTEAITIANSTGVSAAGAIRNISGDNTISGIVITDDGTSRINSDSGLLTISGEFRGDPTSGSNRTATLGGVGNITLSGIVRNGTGTTNGVLTVVKDGAGTLTLSNAANAYTGNTTINAGSLSLSGNINPGLTAATLTMASGTTLNQSSTGVLAGALSVVLNNATTTLAGTNTATGTTAFNGGSLTLDYSTNNTTKLADAAALTLGGGTINLVGGSHREQVLSTTLTAGTTTIVNRPSGTSFLALGAVTPGALSLLSLQGNDFASTTTPNTGGILGGWATVTIGGVTDWGVNSGVTDGGSGSFIRQFTGPYTDITRLGPSTIVDDVTQNVRIINGGTSGNITLASTTNEVSTLRMDASDGPATITMTASVLNIGQDSGSGIIQTATSGGLTVGTVGNEGTLTTGGTANTTAAVLGLVNNGTTNDLTINSAIANNGTDVVTINKDGAGRVVINGTNTNTGTVTIQAGTLHVGAVTGASTTGSLGAGTAVVNNGTLVFRRTDTAAVDLAGSISGSGAVQYFSSGTINQGQFTANNASTYTGGTLIDDARVAAINATAFGTGLVTIAPGGQAFLDNKTYANPFNISGTGWTETAGNLGALRLTGSTISAASSVTLAADARIVADNSGTGTINAVISGDFALQIGGGSGTAGNGILRLNGANTYTGTTTINGVTSGTNFPTLIVGNNTALGTTTNGTVVNGSTSTSSGSIIQLANTVVVTDETLTLNSGAGQRTRLLLAAGSTATWDGNIITSGSGFNQINAEGTLTIGSSSADTVTLGTGGTFGIRGTGSGIMNSTISGPIGITKTDTGTWTLNSTSSSYAGATAISTGTLRFDTIAASAVNSSIGSGTSITLGQNAAGAGGVGTLQFTGASGGSTNRTLSITNGASGGGGIIENTVAGQNLTFSGNISTTTPASASTLGVTGDGNTTLSGNITGTPALSLTKTGTGSLTLSGTSNTASGTTIVDAGTIQVGVAGVGQTGTGAVSLNGTSVLLGTGTVRGSSFTAASGTTIHAGDSTAINSMGTLNFSPTAATAVNFQSGSTIQLGLTTPNVTDATFGGNAIGSAGYNTFLDGQTGLGTGSHDLLNFGGTSGTITFSGNMIISGSGFTPAFGQVFNLIDWAALLTTDFSGFSVGSLLRDGSGDTGSQLDLPDISSFGLNWDVSRFTNSGTLAVVPEPSRLLLMLLGLLGLILRRRRYAIDG